MSSLKDDTTTAVEEVSTSCSNNGDNDVDGKEKVVEKEEWEVQRDGCKERGDVCYRKGLWKDAIQQYSDALALDPTNYILYSNRSASYLSNNEKSRALEDANACIQHCPSKSNFQAKAYSRLGAAYLALKRYQPAIDTYQHILTTIDPKHTIAKQSIQQCQKHLLEQQQKEEEETKKKQQAETEKQQEEEEDDLLDDFFSQVETTTTTKKEEEEEEEKEKPTTKSSNTIQEQLKELGTVECQINRLVNVPNYEWKNLNPFIVLDISHLSTMEQINQRYKALSLLLHPDKKKGQQEQHPKAKLAWEELQKANGILQDDVKRQHVLQLIEQGIKQGKRDYTEKQHVSMEQAQDIAIMKIFAKIENSRRDVERRKRKYEQRERDFEDEEKKRLKDEHQFNQSWKNDTRVEKRIGNWRTFHQSKK